MFTATMIQKMKQNNISVDGEKTKRHLSQTWKAASKQEQETILELAGVARSTVHRSYRSGGVSAKLAMAMGQTLNVDPSYLTGVSDMPGAFTKDAVALFLKAHKYEALIPEWNKNERRQRPSSQPADTAHKPAAEGEEPGAPESAVLDAITEEELIVLVRSLLIKSKVDAGCARRLLKIKQLLVF